MHRKRWLTGLLAGILAGISLLSCNAGEHLIKASGKYGTFSITKPDGWIAMKGELMDGAVLEAGNYAKEQYFLVLRESKDDLAMDFGEYTSIVKQNTAASVQDAELGQSADLTIDGKNAHLFEITGLVDNYKVHYWIYTIDHDGAFLRILSWTLNSKAEEYAPIFKSAALSLKVTAAEEDVQ